jgi:hypothetical protein
MKLKWIRFIPWLVAALLLYGWFELATDPKLIMWSPAYSEHVLLGKTEDEVIKSLGTPHLDNRKTHLAFPVEFIYVSNMYCCRVVFANGKVVHVEKWSK